ASVDGCGPVILNAGQRGYFRSRYPSGPLAELTRHFAELDPRDQLGLVHDTASLAFAGTIPLTQFAELARHVPLSADPVVWIAVVSRLDTLDRAYDEAGRRADFRAAARALANPLLAAVGWEPSPAEGTNVPLLREELIDTLARWGDPAVIAEGRRRYTAFLKDPGAFSAAGRSHALHVAARTADAATWEQLQALAAAATAALEQTQYYRLLGLAADPALAQRSLELALSGELPQTMRPLLIQSVADEHPDLAARYAIAHWPVVERWIEPTFASSYVPFLAAGSADPARLGDLTDFAAAHTPASARNALQVASADIRYRAALRARLGSLDAWLRTNAAPREAPGGSASAGGGE
ncbi:MAG TPA: ERAP1-like C-terminal domain-containing protein, partial [Steroidobacteraceae bacterium]|nr:ERAP1-like C-terminal domain-containing protein [Steroidobacteraceae bacterium]